MKIVNSSNVTMGIIIPNSLYETSLSKLCTILSSPLLIARHSENVFGLLDMILFIKDRVKTMVEIGSFRGESTCIFSRFFDKIYAIDPFVWCSGMAEKEFDKFLKKKF